MRNTLQMKKWYVKWTGEGREWWKGPACDLNKTGYKSSWLSYSQFPYLEILQIYLCYVSLGMIPMVTVDMDYLRWLCGWQTPFRQWDIGVFSHKIIILGKVYNSVAFMAFNSHQWYLVSEHHPKGNPYPSSSYSPYFSLPTPANP